jgi:bifunctional non-homologous end joining protein LigD
VDDGPGDDVDAVVFEVVGLEAFGLEEGAAPRMLLAVHPVAATARITATTTVTAAPVGRRRRPRLRKLIPDHNQQPGAGHPSVGPRKDWPQPRGQDGPMATSETRAGVALTNLDETLFDGAETTKRGLVDYVDALHPQLIGALSDRPLSVIRALRGQQPFMQKNVPKYTPEWVATTPVWSAASKREIAYALCNDRRTLLWFANQRAIEFHPTLFRVPEPDAPTHLVMDLDPPEGSDFGSVVGAAELVRQALAEIGLAGAVKTSGSKGVHIFVPVTGASSEDVALATRALAVRAEALDPALATTAFIKADRDGKVFLDSTRAGGGSVAAAYSPRLRPGTPVSFPVAWSDLPDITPSDFTLRTAPGLLGDSDPWTTLMPAPQSLPPELVEQGRTIPAARAQALHEELRRHHRGEGR